jgi:diguanylate cyclase (GGDEF)-like protein
MVLLLPATDAQDAAAIAEATRTAVLRLRLPHASTALGFVSISLGVAACVPQVDTGAFTLLKAADDALYRAKMKGKNAVELA